MISETITRAVPRTGAATGAILGGSGTVPGVTATALMGNSRPSRAGASASADQGLGTAHQWPLRDFLELGALTGAVPSARLHARHILWEWQLAPLTEAVEQIVSELITNSVAAARAMPYRQPVSLWLLSDTRRVLVLVWDASPQPPALTRADEYDESGRGLLLVQALSERWGTYATPQTGGKIVWALCGMNSGEPA